MKAGTSKLFYTVFICCLATACGNKLAEKGFAVTAPAEDDAKEQNVAGIERDSLAFATRPSNVLLTGHPKYRLATVYKVNFNKDKTTFIGANDFHQNYQDIGETNGNRWHQHYLPGLEAVYGYNLVNISHYNIETQKQKSFFDKPVLVKTLYYPSFLPDTLNHKPVKRAYFMVTVYDEDTNKDGFINIDDLRRFYTFGLEGNRKTAIIPTDHSVVKSEYDPGNDLVYIFAKHDQNKNGRVEDLEPVHIFWVDLQNPERTGKQY